MWRPFLFIVLSTKTLFARKFVLKKAYVRINQYERNKYGTEQWFRMRCIFGHWASIFRVDKQGTLNAVDKFHAVL